jgi:hypothetical protein
MKFRTRPFKLLVGISAFLLLLFPLVPASTAQAASHTCGSDWCSGSDTSTRYNTEGNNPQIYFGEVGYYYHDLGGGGSGPCTGDPGESCFDTDAANGANSRWSANTGLGTQFYYLAGGADSVLEGNYSSAYCFGWAQGRDAEAHIADYFGDWDDSAWWLAIDVEQDNTFGWSSSTKTANRDVFDGFTDAIAGRSDAGSCGGSTSGAFQQEAYSSPDQWSYSFGSTEGNIPNTPIWTYEYCCTSTYPQSYNNADPWGNSDYLEGWQFDQNPDYDVVYEPAYLPVFGIYLGS